MKTLWPLCKIHVLHLCNPKDPRLKQKLLLFVFLAAIGGGYLCAYCFLAARLLSSIHLLNILPSAVFTLASLMALISAVHRVYGSLLHLRDNALLYALPLSKKIIVLSRVLPIYIENLLMMTALFIPCLAALAYYGQFSIGFYIRLLMLLPFAPMLPLGLGMIIGLIIEQISAFFKHSRLMSIVLIFLFIFIFYYYTFQLKNLGSPENLLAFISRLLADIYPLSRLFEDFLTAGSMPSLFGYLFSQLAGISLMLILMVYSPDIKKKSLTAKKRFKTQPHAILHTLFLKEWSRYINSVPYVTNTALAYLMLLGLAVYLQFQDLDALLMVLEMADIKQHVAAFLPLIVGFLISMGTTTPSSIAIEGETFWQNKALPLRPQMIFAAKILLNLSMSVPTVFISAGLISYSLCFNGLEFGLMLGIPLLDTLLFSQIGLICNLYFPHLHWTNETKAVKQGPAVFIQICLSIMICLTPMALIWLNISSNFVIYGWMIGLIAANIGCLLYLSKGADKVYNRIQ